MEPDEIEKYMKAGKIASDVRQWSMGLIKEGAPAIDVADKIEARILELGAHIAFPTNVCIGDVAAHYAPKLNDKTEIGGVVSIDLGVHVDGFIADTAYTVDLSGEYKKMLKANEAALSRAISLVKPGVSVCEIGRAVQETITGAGFRPIENLTGHEVKQYELHAGLSIPNVPVPYDRRIKEGMVIAIEPFATDGAGRIVEGKHAEIFSLIAGKPSRIPESRTLINLLQERHGLPFAAHWYAKRINPLKLTLAIQDILSRGALKAHPVLHEKEEGTVSQFEHTVMVTKDGCVVTTR
ncbi:MAG: type II methionyl aminopeptidase [Candidatus Altiarchaeales archaeon IMC4]|nr:MAG: type II methionyl aminopeptidase [Candidatus Altiarchaeales archaeon IMC4]